MTIKEVIEQLSQFSGDTKVFSFNEDDQIYSQGVNIWYDKDFNGVVITDRAAWSGYRFDRVKEKWVWVE